MHALGVPTTRSLAAASTGETVYRERDALPGAVLTRVAASHIRIGTFEYFALRGDVEGLKALADYSIERHYPDVAKCEQPYVGFSRALRAPRRRSLPTGWMSASCTAS